MEPVALPHPRRSKIGALSVVSALWLVQPAAVSAAEEIKIGGTGSGLATMQLLADAFATQRFIAFVRSSAGREVLARTGHWVP